MTDDARSRVPSFAGFVQPSKLPRGPNGLPPGRWCRARGCPTKRNTFCSPECVHEHKLRTDPSYQARHVLERDKGCCAECGRDCLALLAELKRLRADERLARWGERARFLGERGTCIDDKLVA